MTLAAASAMCVVHIELWALIHQLCCSQTLGDVLKGKGDWFKVFQRDLGQRQIKHMLYLLLVFWLQVKIHCKSNGTGDTRSILQG